MALRQAGIEAADAEALAPDIAGRAGQAALVFARRRRIGPFGPAGDDRAARERQLAAMLRAGHAFDLSRRIVAARSEDELRELE
jgi:regulatory protein